MGSIKKGHNSKKSLLSRNTRPFLLTQTYYAISNCILQDRILLHKVAANCSVFFRCWVTSVFRVDLEGQSCNDLCPAASGDLPMLYAMHGLSRKLTWNFEILRPVPAHRFRPSLLSLQEMYNNNVFSSR